MMALVFDSRGVVGSVGLIVLVLLLQQPWPSEAFVANHQGAAAPLLDDRLAQPQQRRDTASRSRLNARLGIDDNDGNGKRDGNNLPIGTSNRRNLLLHSLGGGLAAISLVASSSSPLPVQAVVLDNNSNNNNNLSAEKISKLTPDQARQRFRDGYASLSYLLDHFDEICDGGGDNVRRYLGTVGFTSGLVGMEKTLKVLEQSDSVDDIVEYTELSQELIRCIQQADGSSYMAIFVTTSPLQVPPSKYFNDAKIEIQRAKQAMQSLAKMIDVDLTTATTTKSAIA